MIRAKKVMEHLRENDEQHENIHVELRDVESKLDAIGKRIKEISERMERILDEVCRLEVSVAMWQRKYEQTLIKEDKTNGT